MGDFLIGTISVIGGVILGKTVIAILRCIRNSRNHENDRNQRNSSDSNREETSENIENAVVETKQNNNDTEIKKNQHNKFYDEMDQKLKILHQKADKALEADKALKSEALISHEAK